MIFLKSPNNNHFSFVPPDTPEWGMTGQLPQIGRLKALIYAVTDGLNPPVDDPFIHNAFMAPTVPQMPQSIGVKPPMPPTPTPGPIPGPIPAPTPGPVTGLTPPINPNPLYFTTGGSLCPSCTQDEINALNKLLSMPGFPVMSIIGGQGVLTVEPL